MVASATDALFSYFVFLAPPVSSQFKCLVALLFGSVCWVVFLSAGSKAPGFLCVLMQGWLSYAWVLKGCPLGDVAGVLSVCVFVIICCVYLSSVYAAAI